MRLELKYIVPAHLKVDLVSSCEAFLKASERASYPVSSIYFDTPDHQLLSEKIEGQDVRHKLRIRSYHYDFLNSKEEGKAEIKSRYRDQTHKESLPLSMGSLKSCLLHQDWTQIDRMDEEGVFLRFRGRGQMVPHVKISYHREAYESKEESALRVTFDSLLSAFPPFYEVPVDYIHRPDQLLIPEHHSILEIKSPYGVPDWLLSIIRSFRLKRVSLSKFAVGMQYLNEMRLI